MKALKADGQDVEAVYKVARQALEHARSGKGPVFVHLDTCRFTGHYIGDPQVYRDEGAGAGAARDARPDRAPAREARPRRRGVRRARRRGDGDGRGVGRVREERHRSGAGGRAEERLCLSSPTAKPSATRSSQAMRQDEDVFVMGEDIAEMGGSMGVTHGMLEEFGPARVRNTPISEMALAGAAIGAALQGMRPVAEIMYEDFMTLAAEQVVNQAAKHPLHVGRPAHRARRLPHAGRRGVVAGRAARAAARGVVRAHPRAEGRVRVDARGRARPAVVVDLRRQPCRLLRAPDAVRDQGRGAARRSSRSRSGRRGSIARART